MATKGRRLERFWSWQDHGEFKFELDLTGELLARKKSRVFLAGPIPFCQFIPKCTTNSLPWREKSHSNSLPGVVGKEKVKKIPHCSLARPHLANSCQTESRVKK